MIIFLLFALFFIQPVFSAKQYTPIDWKTDTENLEKEYKQKDTFLQEWQLFYCQKGDNQLREMDALREKQIDFVKMYSSWLFAPRSLAAQSTPYKDEYNKLLKELNACSVRLEAYTRNINILAEQRLFLKKEYESCLKVQHSIVFHSKQA